MKSTASFSPGTRAHSMAREAAATEAVSRGPADIGIGLDLACPFLLRVAPRRHVALGGGGGARDIEIDQLLRLLLRQTLLGKQSLGRVDKAGISDFRMYAD